MIKKIPKSRRGLSLVELAVVLTIMMMVTGAVWFTFSDRESEGNLAQAEQVMEGMLRISRLKAQAEAQSPKGERPLLKAVTRLIVHADPSDPEKYLRYIGVVYGDADDQRWYAELKGRYLPKGVYVMMPEVDRANQYSMNLEYPKGSGRNPLQLNENGEKWLYYEFSTSGLVDCRKKTSLKLAQGRHSKSGELEFLRKGAVVTFRFSHCGKVMASSGRSNH